jgi:hypothetical protein
MRIIENHQGSREEKDADKESVWQALVLLARRMSLISGKRKPYL